MSTATATAEKMPKPLLSDARLGDVTMTGDTLEVVFHRHFRAPIEKVWAALTVPERLADWFGEATVDLRVGGSIGLSWNGSKETEVKITVCEPPHSLAWIWQIGGRDTLVRFDLASEAGGCALTLTHSGVPAVGEGVRAGWHAHLEALPDAIEGKATPWETKVAREKALAGAYPQLPA
jgi:uncharacterized protein YndB with AHSA1/START domain